MIIDREEGRRCLEERGSGRSSRGFSLSVVVCLYWYYAWVILFFVRRIRGFVLERLDDLFFRLG